MGKESRTRVLADHQAKAIGRLIRNSPRKLNLVAQSIRGKTAEGALNELTFSPKRVAKTVKKVLQAAIANAENKKEDTDVDRLFVVEAYVNEGPRQKRVRPAPMGRAYRYQRRTSHIVVKVGDKSTPEQE